jgi:peptidoglycan/LPS O-acetylase OafA/YrhL
MHVANNLPASQEVPLDSSIETGVAVHSVSRVQANELSQIGLPVVSTHLHFLDGLRALAAIYVLIHHAILQVDVASSTSAFVQTIALLFAHGRYAVDLFIVISGFCLMLPVVHNGGVLRQGAFGFFLRRIKRILPTYYIAMAISLGLIFTAIGEKTNTNWNSSLPVTMWDVITHLFLIQDLFDATMYKINHVFWSISVEFHIYLLFPALVLSWRKWSPTLTTIGSLLLSLGLWVLLGHSSLNVYGMAPHYIALFTFGMLATQLVYASLEWWKLGLIAAFIVLVALVYPIMRADLLVGVVSASLLVLAATRQVTVLHQLLSWQPLVFIGSFAYSIYLIHAPLLQIFSAYILLPYAYSPSQSIMFFLLVGTPVVVGLSYIFYLLAERPFMLSARKPQARLVAN